MPAKFQVGQQVDTLAVVSGEVRREGEGPGTIVSVSFSSRLGGYLYGVRWPGLGEQKYPAEYLEEELVQV